MDYANKTFTIVTCHFGDSWWLSNLISNVNKCMNEAIKEILVFDNSGNLDKKHFSNSRLRIKILEGKLELEGNRQHAATLNLIKNQNLSTTHVIIIDTDIVFLSSNWTKKLLMQLNNCDSVLALVEGSKCLAHSCFQVIPVRTLSKIDFALAMYELNFDTGRLTGLQLSQLGEIVKMVSPAPKRGLNIGYFYEESEFLHITSASVRNIENRSTKLKYRFLVMWRNQLLKDVASLVENTGGNIKNIKYLLLYTKSFLKISLHILLNKNFNNFV